MDDPIKSALHKHLKEVPPSKVEGLASKLTKLPVDQALALLDIGISLSGSSLRTVMEFLRVAPEVSRHLSAHDIRLWGDIGKRLASVNADVAASFFGSSLRVLESLPAALRSCVLAVCDRQAMISGPIAFECFISAPRVIKALADETTASRVYATGYEIAKRSATQSAEFLNKAPDIIASLRSASVARRVSVVASEKAFTSDPLSEPRPTAEALIDRALNLALTFAERAGGLATEFFILLPRVMPVAEIEKQLTLLDYTRKFLERGGGMALQYFQVAAQILTMAGASSLDRWTALAYKIAQQDTAAVFNFLKITPRVVAALARLDPPAADQRVCDVLDVARRVSERNVFLAIECFKSSPQALASATLEQFAAWASAGLRLPQGDGRRVQAYYALQTRASRESLRRSEGGLTLDEVLHTLRLYIEGLSGKSIVIKPMSVLPDQVSVNDGKEILLPAAISEFGDKAADFRLYKILAARGAGQIEFGTYASDLPKLVDLQQELCCEYGSQKPEARRDSPHDEQLATSDAAAVANNPVDFSSILSLFPDRELARQIFTTLENGRIDFLLRANYRGIRRDLDFVQARLKEKRPQIGQLPPDRVFHEILFRIAMLGQVDEFVRQRYPQMVQALEAIVESFVKREAATVADSLRATHLIYRMFKPETSPSPTSDSEPSDQEAGQQEATQESDQQQVSTGAPVDHARPRSELQGGLSLSARSFSRRLPTESEWREEADDSEEEGCSELEPGDQVFYYDEWDHELADFRASWCRVIEKAPRRGGREFVEYVRSQYGPIISSIRYQFERMRPEALQKIKGELDGEDFDLQAVIDYALDRQTSGRVSERLYVRRLHRQREVAVSFLLDMSSSTARTVSPRSPRLGTPARPSKRIIDIEKEGLVLMSEALEAVGDIYSIQGFTSEGRHNVKFYVIKGFDQPYSPEIEARIGGITYQNNTRLGAAIRHATERLIRQEAKTKLLIVLSDGRPYDHDYGDSRYAREDTKIALRQARMAGVTPFCITIDRESELHLREMYGDVGYTIIDDILSLPERLPGIYRRLTH